VGYLGYNEIVKNLGDRSVVVLGSGVVGMTTAVCLAEAGANVNIVADKPSKLTTSAVAGALWGPYVSEDPRVLDWSLESLPDLMHASLDKSSGVQIVRGVEAAREVVSPPRWLQRAWNFALCLPEELPAEYTYGWSYSAPIFDMPVYLAYLQERAMASGVSIDIIGTPISSLGELTAHGSVIVNCSGLGARWLVPDSAMSSAWGQLVVVENPGIDGFFSDFPESHEPTYFIAHADHVILGGYVDHERTDLAPDEGIANSIRDRCYKAEPRLESARVIECRTGLRPVRPRVRLEREERDEVLVIHNYGHGGSGVTLSWGCARHLLSLLVS
jgi:D-amino-acid oxidase